MGGGGVMSDHNTVLTLLSKYGAMTHIEALEKVEYLNTLNANQAARIAGLEAELVAARADLEKLQRVLAVTEAQSKLRFQQVMTMRERHAEAVRERDSLQQHCDRLTGMKFSDRMHAALVARAEGAEADLARARNSDEHNFERWRRAVAERDALNAELGSERMRLAACSAVALADTPDSAKEARQMHPDYRSAACDDVARTVDECIALRAQRDELRKAMRGAADWLDLMYRTYGGAEKGEG